MIVLFFSQPAPVAHVPPTSGYAPGMSVLAESQAGKRVQGQGHPLKSFTVPAPPPISAPGTPQPKHVGTLLDLPLNKLTIHFDLLVRFFNFVSHYSILICIHIHQIR